MAPIESNWSPVSTLTIRPKLKRTSPRVAKRACLNANKAKAPIKFDPTTCNSNNNRTPFVTLPQEIKNDIYELVLGGNVVHIWVRILDRRPIMEHNVCHARLSEEASHKAFQETDAGDWQVKGVTDRHADCDKTKSAKINVSLLYVCRQVYDEARFVAFSTNTFSFSKLSVARTFSHQIKQSTDFNLTLRSIHLDLNLPTIGTSVLAKGIDVIVDRMSKVEHISICMNQPHNWSETIYQDEKLLAMKPIADSLMKLARLPLKTWTMVVTDKTVEKHRQLFMNGVNGFNLGRRWTVGERRKWADKLVGAILAPGNQGI